MIPIHIRDLVSPISFSYLETHIHELIYTIVNVHISLFLERHKHTDVLIYKKDTLAQIYTQIRLTYMLTHLHPNPHTAMHKILLQ